MCCLLGRLLRLDLCFCSLSLPSPNWLSLSWNIHLFRCRFSALQSHLSVHSCPAEMQKWWVSLQFLHFVLTKKIVYSNQQRYFARCLVGRLLCSDLCSLSPAPIDCRCREIFIHFAAVFLPYSHIYLCKAVMQKCWSGGSAESTVPPFCSYKKTVHSNQQRYFARCLVGRLLCSDLCSLSPAPIDCRCREIFIHFAAVFLPYSHIYLCTAAISTTHLTRNWIDDLRGKLAQKGKQNDAKKRDKKQKKLLSSTTSLNLWFSWTL